jgi:ubiquinone/menaquinone biosynthesis C-methylase UbiE
MMSSGNLKVNLVDPLSTAWDAVFRTGGFALEEPQPALVALCGLLRERYVHRICDLGCGTGRNLIFLAQQGFEVCGVDLSAEGLRQAREKAKVAGLHVELRLSNMTAIPYPDSSFDAVICVYAIYHSAVAEMRLTLTQAQRVLRDGGLLFVTFQTRRSHKYGQGRPLEAHTFVQDFPPEVNIPHHFSSEEEVRELMRAFRIMKLELEELETGDGKLHSHWQVLAEKP